MTYKSGGWPNGLKLYVNGTLEKEAGWVDGPIVPDDGTYNLNLAQWAAAGQNHRRFAGLIDDAAIYRRALSAEEISERMKNSDLFVKDVSGNTEDTEDMDPGGMAPGSGPDERGGRGPNDRRGARADRRLLPRRRRWRHLTVPRASARGPGVLAVAGAAPAVRLLQSPLCDDRNLC